MRHWSINNTNVLDLISVYIHRLLTLLQFCISINEIFIPLHYAIVVICKIWPCFARMDTGVSLGSTVSHLRAFYLSSRTVLIRETRLI